MMSEEKRGRSGQAFGLAGRDTAHAFAPKNMVNGWLTRRARRLLTAGSALASLAFAGPAHAAPYLATTEIVTGSLLLGVLEAGASAPDEELSAEGEALLQRLQAGKGASTQAPNTNPTAGTPAA